MVVNQRKQCMLAFGNVLPLTSIVTAFFDSFWNLFLNVDIYSIAFAVKYARINLFVNIFLFSLGAIQVLRNAFFLEIGPPPTPS